MAIQTNPLDAPGTPFDVELLNPNPTGKRVKGSPIYRVSFEIDKSAYDCFMAMREGNLRIAARMVVMPDTDEELAQKALEGKTKAKAPKGPNGALWYALRVAGFPNCPGVRDAIEKARIHPAEDSWQILHRMFDATSLATVSAEKIYEIFPPESYPQARVMIEQAIRKIGERGREEADESDPEQS